jgi:hypothetical protein
MRARWGLLVAVVAGLLFAATPAQAGIAPVESFTVSGSIDPKVSYQAPPVLVTVPDGGGVRVDASFTPTRRAAWCLRYIAPGLTVTGPGYERRFGEVGKTTVIWSDPDLTGGTYTVTPFYSCRGDYTLQVYIYPPS